MSKTKKLLLILFIIIIAFISIVYSKKPSLERDWTLDQKILSSISFSWNIVNIKNIRNFKYFSEDNYEANYYDENYDLDKIESLYYIIEPFSEYNWPAHTMFSFWFTDWKYLTISIEIRKEKWESFSALKWLLNEYELVYMIWDENDLVKLRANYRKDEVFMYPINAYIGDKELFVSMLRRADKLWKKAEFYNTFTNNCTTNIQKHANDIRITNIPWTKYLILPSESDKVVYEYWLIDTNLSLSDARKYYKINELSQKYWDNPNYSKLIRKERK